eukprot:g8722.t1
MSSFQHRGSPHAAESGGQEPPRKRHKGVYTPAQGQHYHPQPQTPRYIPGGGGGDRSFSSPPAPPTPSPFSPPTTPHANGRGTSGGGQFGPAAAASWETSQPQAPPLPHGANRRQLSFQGSRGVALSFNYWVGRALSNQVITPSVRQLVTSALAGEPAPEFVEKVPAAKKVVIACVSGLGMAEAEKSMAAGRCPFLMSCSSVPVRHSLEHARSRGPPRAADVQPCAALILWGEKPTISAEERAAMSLSELFQDCEVTFAGSKSAGWKDDVSFHPSLSPSPSPSTPDAGVTSSAPQQEQQQQQQQQQEATTCRGNFWRNQNRDRGKYTLEVEEGGEAARLRLAWDRWDEEVLALKERKGGNLRFEAPDSSLSLTFSCARHLTDQEKKLARQPEAAPPPLVRVVVVDSSSPSSPPTPDNANPSETAKPAATGNSSAAISDGGENTAPEQPPEATAGGGGGDDASPSSTNASAHGHNEVVIRVPLESLDPEAYCLTPAARYRLDMPIRVSEEGPGYVSTEDPMPPQSPPPHPHHQANGERQGQGVRDSQDQGRREIGKVVEELEQEQEQEPEREEEEEDEEEEEGEIEEGELEIAPAPTSGVRNGANGKARVEYGGDSTEDEEDEDEDEEIATISPAGGLKDPSPAAAVEPVAGSGAFAEGTPPSGGQGGGGKSEGNGGLTRVSKQQQRESVFVPPSAEELCPIPSGPRKGTVILGVDCEMVYTKEGLALARATLVNVKGQKVYDELVKPTLQVTDYNTQFSGITAEMLKGVTRTLRDAQREILSFVSAETYLVGHSLDSDLKALRLVHRRLIDTSELYPSSRGKPFKNGLRVLSKTVLGRGIQGGDAGHDSGEDAVASLELALLKMHRGPAFEVPSVWAAKPNPPKESLFESLERRRLSEPLRCKVSGDLEARASAEHPPGTPLWTVFNCGYRREQDAVWTAMRFRRNGGCGGGEGSSGGCSDNQGIPSSSSGDESGSAASPDATAAAGSSSSSYSSSLASSSQGDRTAAMPVTVGAAHFSTAGGMLRDALDSLMPKGGGAGGGKGSSSGPPSLLWVDLPCRRNDFELDDNGNDKNWSSLPEVDRAVSQLYDKMAEGTLLVVVCQGALTSMVNLMAKRTKSRWDANSKERMDVISGRKRDQAQTLSTFDRHDEDELEMVTSECLNGMCFLACK